MKRSLPLLTIVRASQLRLPAVERLIFSRAHPYRVPLPADAEEDLYLRLSKSDHQVASAARMARWFPRANRRGFRDLYRRLPNRPRLSGVYSTAARPCRRKSG